MLTSAEQVTAARSRPSGNEIVPFDCEFCETAYEDYPALIIVETADGDLSYCTDNCAESAGWTDAVARRIESELAGESISIIYTPATAVA